MLYFECPSCKANCETTPAYSGKAVHCPHCGKSITVPTDPAAITTTPPAPKPKPAPASTAVTTPDVAAAQQARQNPGTPSIAQNPSGNQVRNVILVLVGIAVLVFVGIWLVPADTPKDSKGKTMTDGANPVVVMETSMGTVKMELFQDKAPISTANFLKYVETKHYDGTIFHRIIREFMIQGGGFTPGMKREKPGFEPIRNEARNGVSNTRGTLAMARTGDPNSATSQFFINVVDNSRKLGPGGVDAHGYAVFGQVIDGMDVVDKIRAVETGREDVPIKDVVIKSIRVQP
jgi:peptidyl-prolyl cis-trans isomerase A (cyclophilin A)